jgi:threonine/homoserine/homoserine lactone efflux protein
MLPDYPSLLLFLSATLILNLIPGADVLYVASQSLISKKQGIFAVLGGSTGISIYILGTAFGLSEVLRHSMTAFNLIKIIGALYLAYLAWQAFFKPHTDNFHMDNNKKLSELQAYLKGILTTVLNPKVGLFFLTFLPQFTDVHRGKVWLQLISLGGCFIISGALVNLMYVFVFEYLKKHLFFKPPIQKWFNKITGLIFCALALKVLTARQ